MQWSQVQHLQLATPPSYGPRRSQLSCLDRMLNQRLGWTHMLEPLCGGLGSPCRQSGIAIKPQAPLIIGQVIAKGSSMVEGRRKTVRNIFDERPQHSPVLLMPVLIRDQRVKDHEPSEDIETHTAVRSLKAFRWCDVLKNMPDVHQGVPRTPHTRTCGITGLSLGGVPEITWHLCSLQNNPTIVEAKAVWNHRERQ